MRKSLLLLIVFFTPICLNGQTVHDQPSVSGQHHHAFIPEDCQFEVSKKTIEEGLHIHSFSLIADDSHAPAIIKWRFPATDMQFVWTTEFQGSIKPDWHHQSVTSRATNQAPVLCIMNGDNRNRYTIAVSDALNTIELKAGVIEETGEMEMMVKIHPEAFIDEASCSFDLRIDERPILYWHALRNVSDWWASFEDHAPLHVPDSAKRPMYSTWYTFHQQLDVEAVLEECRIARSLGCRAVIVDDGWQTLDSRRGYAYTGDWKPERIPDMRSFVERTHDLDLKFILWYSVPFAGRNSEAKKRFEGKFLDNAPDLGAYTLDPRYPEVRAYLIDIYQQALLDWDLDGFKLDFVDQFKAGQETPPAGPGMDHVSVNRAVDRLLTDVMKALTAIKPDILIEFRQRYIGPLMRKYGNMFRASDCPYGLLDNRIRTCNLRLISGGTAVHSDMLMWHGSESTEAAAMQLLNVMFSVPQISIRLADHPREHREMLGFWLKFWNAHRKTLLEGEFHPCHPNHNFPIILGKTEEESIAGLYNPGFVVPVHENDPVERVYVMNASGDHQVMIDFSGNSSSWDSKIHSCTGRMVEEKTIVAKGIVKFKVPVSGLLELSRRLP